MRLAAWLENTPYRDDSVVSFPASTSGAISGARPRGTNYDMHEVEAIVLALERRNSNFSECLDSLSLTILCSIFIYSRECLAQQRGLCLLVKVLHRNEGDSAEKATQKQQKKLAVGHAALTSLIRAFLRTDPSKKLRRWFGVLALELLKECPKNTQKLQSDLPEEKYWQNLGAVIERESCQVLKLLAGFMIREMLGFGVLPDEFWPTETDLDTFSKFPKNQHTNSQWITSFEEFVDELVLRKILTQEVSSVVFAHAVHVGDRKWDLEEASDILVTVSEELNIIVPENDTSPAIYIDVALSSISNVSFDELVTDSQQPSYGLVMQLIGETATNCMINANGYAKNHVALAFASKKDANTLRRLLEPTKARTDRNTLQSQSEAVNVSEDDGPTASDSALINNQSLVRTTFPASASIPHRYPVTSINPAILHRSHHASADHQENSLDSTVEQDGNISNVRHYIEMAEEIDVSESDGLVNKAIESIDVSQAYALSREDTRDGSEVGRAVVPMDRVQENLEGFDRNLDIGLSSSSRRHKGLKAIQNAPAIRAQPSQQVILSVQPVENRHRSEAEDGGFDELYDASPKMNYSRRPSPRTVAHESAPSNAERTPGPTARQPNVATEPSIKLSRQLRNDNGVVGPHTEQCADTGLAAMTEDAAGDVKAKANSKKKKVPIPVKANTLALNSKEPTKPMARTSLKPIPTAESSNAATDNYNIPPSPTRISSNVQDTGNKKDAVTTQPKPTKAPAKRPAQHKPVPTKAIPNTSSKGPVSRLKKAVKDKPEAKNPKQERALKTQSGKKVTYDVDDDTIWDVDLAYSEGKPQVSPEKHQPPKAEAKTIRTAKTKKGKDQSKVSTDKAKADKVTKTRTQAARARVVKAKPRPAALSQPRSRRAAAIKANQKIQGLVESDEIEDDEDIVPADTRSRQPAPSGIARAPRDKKTQNGRDDRTSSGGELPSADSPGKDLVLDNVSPKASDKQKLDSATKTDSSPEKVDIVRSVAKEVPSAKPSPMKNISQKESTTGTLMIPPLAGHGDHSEQQNVIFDEKDFEVAEARAKLVPVNAPRLQNSIAKTQSAPNPPPKEGKMNQGCDDRNQDQAVIQRAKIIFEREKVEGYVTPLHAPPAQMVVDIRQRRTVPRSAEPAQESSPKSTGRRHDPFGTKLNALLLEPKDANSNIQSDENVRDINVEGRGLDTAKLASSLTESIAKASEKPQRYLKSLMQVDGKGDDSPYLSSKPAVESVSASRVEVKRKGEQEEDTRPKRLKVAPRELLDRALDVQESMNNANTAKKTPLLVTKNKPSVIGFSTSGPRNQGIILTQKTKTPHEFVIEWGMHDATSTTINKAEKGLAPVRETLQVSPEEVQNNLENLSGALKKIPSSPRRGETEHLKTLEAVRLSKSDTQDYQNQKRKFTPFLDETVQWEHKHISKRPKRGVATPPSANANHPKMLPDPSPAVAHDRSQRLSSQTTRVNENGSPMPFLINPSENIADEEQYPDEDDGKEALAEAQLEDQFALQEYDTVLTEPVLPHRPIVSAVSILQPKTMTSQIMSSNSKQIPSSPHAASVFGTMPPHHIYHDGEIVNPETKESIIPIKPQDPFLGATRNPQNQFMEALRRSSELASKRLTSGVNDRRRSGAVSVRQTHDVGEDPEKTLVEPERRKYRQNYVSSSSSNSQSGTSTQVSQPDESSEGGKNGEADAKWRKALEPHQGNMLESLLAISHHLIRHLIDKETAIHDIVTDFANHGKNLIGGYERGLQEHIDARKADHDLRRQNLAKVFTKAQADRERTSKAVAIRSVGKIKARWEERQKALKTEMAAALAACAE